MEGTLAGAVLQHSYDVEASWGRFGHFGAARRMRTAFLRSMTTSSIRRRALPCINLTSATWRSRPFASKRRSMTVVY